MKRRDGKHLDDFLSRLSGWTTPALHFHKTIFEGIPIAAELSLQLSSTVTLRAITEQPSLGSKAAMMNGKMTEEDTSTDSPNDGNNSAKKGSANGISANPSVGRQAIEQRPPHVRFAESAKREDGPSRVGVHKVPPELQKQQSNGEPATNAADPIARQSKSTGSSSRRNTKHKCSKPNCKKRHISKQPLRHEYPLMRPRPLADLTAAYTTIASNDEVYKASETAKGPIRARARELENYTTWQRLKWRS
ncbi:Nn.00g093310.m01.CDS01 [Neocucurbitaria sp. VM-36]